MKIAQQLRENNIAEYLIYMWQVEDLIRANGCDIDKLDAQVVSLFPKEERNELHEWYDNLLLMMRNEQVTQHGHLQINKNIIISLTELHSNLLASPKFPFYNAAYYKALPYIVELRSKNGQKDEPELETCFEALYGVLLLRLQKKEVSKDTLKAIEDISSLLSLLSNYYNKDRKGELKLED